MNQKSTRRYLVKGYAESPAWSGCTWAYGCSKLDSASNLFSKKETLFLSKESDADYIVLIDRQDGVLIKQIGLANPSAYAKSMRLKLRLEP